MTKENGYVELGIVTLDEFKKKKRDLDRNRLFNPIIRLLISSIFESCGISSVLSSLELAIK